MKLVLLLLGGVLIFGLVISLEAQGLGLGMVELWNLSLIPITKDRLLKVEVNVCYVMSLQLCMLLKRYC